MDNRRINIPSKSGGSALQLFRDERGNVSASISEDGEFVEMAMIFTEAHLARLRTWLNTGISPSRDDLVDPVPRVIQERRRATFDPQPRDFRAHDESEDVR